MKPSELRVEPLEDRSLPSANVVLEWNQLALHAIGQARVSPVVASRALAITEAAVYDSVVAIDGSFEPYHAHVHASHGASLEAAAAQAAHDTLTALFPTQAGTFDSALASDLTGIPPGRARQGIDVGREVARQILDWRSTDRSGEMVRYTPGTAPGNWQPTPPANLPALAPQWPDVTPFAMTSGSQFRPAPPPALDSAAYAAAFNEVKSLGRADSTTRTDEQTQIARFWNDGLGTAFAMGYWNRIAAQVATDQGLSLVQDARVFALLNIAEADAHIACWDAKYTYNLWRPVTAIRAADTDGNPGTEPDATWTPLLVTPNFPSYTSAHSTLSAAAAGVLTALFGVHYHFTVGAESVSYTRSFGSFDAAAAEAGQSRIYGGIHYQFDNQAAQASGHAVGRFVVGNFLRPAEEEHEADIRHEDHPGGRGAFPADGLVLLLAGPCSAASADWSWTGEQPMRLHPQSAEVLTATGVAKDPPIQHAGARDRPAARALQLRAFDQALAGLDDSGFAEAVEGDKVFAGAR
jgi:membrane-associated phospholipid phosphatase